MTYVSGWKDMEGLLFRYGITGQADAQFLENLLVHFAEHHRAMYLAAFKSWQAHQGFLAVLVP